MNKALLVLTLAACNPYLMAQSPAPPGRTAHLEAVTGFWNQVKYYRVDISQGVALAVNCYHGGPCQQVKVTSSDPAIADVRPASLSVLERQMYTGEALGTASAIVIVGKKPGETKLHLTTDDGDRDIVVTVISPPTPGSAQTVAR